MRLKVESRPSGKDYERQCQLLDSAVSFFHPLESFACKIHKLLSPLSSLTKAELTAEGDTAR